jgi:dynein light chain roadblock-type
MQTHKNVQGIVIVNGEGSIIRSTYLNEKKDEGKIEGYVGISLARLIPQLVVKAKSVVRDLDSQNDLKFIRLKTTKN